MNRNVLALAFVVVAVATVPAFAAGPVVSAKCNFHGVPNSQGHCICQRPWRGPACDVSSDAEATRTDSKSALPPPHPHTPTPEPRPSPPAPAPAPAPTPAHVVAHPRCESLEACGLAVDRAYTIRHVSTGAFLVDAGGANGRRPLLTADIPNEGGRSHMWRFDAEARLVSLAHDDALYFRPTAAPERVGQLLRKCASLADDGECVRTVSGDADARLFSISNMVPCNGVAYGSTVCVYDSSGNADVWRLDDA